MFGRIAGFSWTEWLGWTNWFSRIDRMVQHDNTKGTRHVQKSNLLVMPTENLSWSLLSEPRAKFFVMQPTSWNLYTQTRRQNELQTSSPSPNLRLHIDQTQTRGKIYTAQSGNMDLGTKTWIKASSQCNYYCFITSYPSSGQQY